MFGSRIQREARRFAEKVVRPLAAIGLTPNGATLLGLAMTNTRPDAPPIAANRMYNKAMTLSTVG